MLLMQALLLSCYFLNNIIENNNNLLLNHHISPASIYCLFFIAGDSLWLTVQWSETQERQKKNFSPPSICHTHGAHMFRLNCDPATVSCKITITPFIFQDYTLIHLRLLLTSCPLLGKQKKRQPCFYVIRKNSEKWITANANSRLDWVL